MVGFIPRGGELKVFKTTKAWSPSRRKFRKLGIAEIRNYWCAKAYDLALDMRQLPCTEEMVMDYYFEGQFKNRGVVAVYMQNLIKELDSTDSGKPYNEVAFGNKVEAYGLKKVVTKTMPESRSPRRPCPWSRC